jgi:hypothetical protein
VIKGFRPGGGGPPEIVLFHLLDQPISGKSSVIKDGKEEFEESDKEFAIGLLLEVADRLLDVAG